MGIRICNNVGWGLDLTGLNKDVLTSFDKLEDDERFTAWRREAIKYAKEHDDMREKMTFHHMEEPATGLYEMIAFDEEFGIENKLLLFPHGYQKQWSRYGDLLDVYEYEATHAYDGPDWMTPEWIEKPGTLYPFVGLMRANHDKPLGYEEYWESCYLDNEEMKNAIPVAPAHLWFLIKHLELVPEDRVTEVFLKLRPTFYRMFV